MPAICLMGPTATGKTALAVRLAETLPLDLISVDSALVYRGMDIGTAKPDAATLCRFPHSLIDIREPECSYSAGEFVRDAGLAIAASRERNRVPLLVGGTMMYFRALIAGMATLPMADSAVRADIDAEAAAGGWPALHQQLAAVDPKSARRISRNDGQRIQRALEVYRLSGRPLSELQADTAPDPEQSFVQIGLLPADRAALHRRIVSRLDDMMAAGFLDEVRRLKSRPGLSADSASMRAVGYRQLWSHLDGDVDLPGACERAAAATRQLAKRQVTWLRSDSRLRAFDPVDKDVFEPISSFLRQTLDK